MALTDQHHTRPPKRVWLVLLGAVALAFAAQSELDPGPVSARQGSVAPAPRSLNAQESGEVLHVTASSLRLRAGPSTHSAVLGGAARGAPVQVLGRKDGWANVALQDGTRGWMSERYLAARDTGSSAPKAPPVPARDYADAVGRATITDGDTIRISGAAIRLEGIDAPESGQACLDARGARYPCGGRAANALDGLIGRQTVACRSEGTDRYDRMIGTCVLRSTGESLNAFMVRSGWALAYRTYSTAYVAEEAQAKAEKRGLWQGKFVAPWDYRDGIRLSQGAAAPSQGLMAAPSSGRAAGRACNIKGNISDSGRIYHVPGSRWYPQTQINTNRGERWFCSEGEARAAGWRAPRG